MQINAYVMKLRDSPTPFCIYLSANRLTELEFTKEHKIITLYIYIL